MVWSSGCSVAFVRVKDDRSWRDQLAEFDADEMSRKFRDFLLFWCGAAERMVDSYQLTPTVGLRRSFEVAEQTFGYISVEWLGQMLLVLIQHWFDGDEVWESLSVWERRLVEQAAAVKVVELQQSAASADLSVIDP